MLLSLESTDVGDTACLKLFSAVVSTIQDGALRTTLVIGKLCNANQEIDTAYGLKICLLSSELPLLLVRLTQSCICGLTTC